LKVKDNWKGLITTIKELFEIIKLTDKVFKELMNFNIKDSLKMEKDQEKVF
jgi:hypothetical protein